MGQAGISPPLENAVAPLESLAHLRNNSDGRQTASVRALAPASRLGRCPRPTRRLHIPQPKAVREADALAGVRGRIPTTAPAPRFPAERQTPSGRLTSAAERRGAQGAALVAPLCQPSEFMKRPFHLPKSPNMRICQCSQGCYLHCRLETGDIPGGARITVFLWACHPFCLCAMA